MTTDKYRHVSGGLDNAVRQAEKRRLGDMFIVDADCHIDEPFTWFPRYLPEELRKKYNDIQNMNAVENTKKITPNSQRIPMIHWIH